jgi:hypothetical protein
MARKVNARIAANPWLARWQRKGNIEKVSMTTPEAPTPQYPRHLRQILGAGDAACLALLHHGGQSPLARAGPRV